MVGMSEMESNDQVVTNGRKGVDLNGDNLEKRVLLGVHAANGQCRTLCVGALSLLRALYEPSVKLQSTSITQLIHQASCCQKGHKELTSCWSVSVDWL